MNWRTDLENAPKDKEILVCAIGWQNELYLEKSYWTLCDVPYSEDGFTKHRLENRWCTWDAKEECPVEIYNITHWCEIALPIEWDIENSHQKEQP